MRGEKKKKKGDLKLLSFIAKSNLLFEIITQNMKSQDSWFNSIKCRISVKYS